MDINLVTLNERLNYKNFAWVLENTLTILRESKNWLKKLINKNRLKKSGNKMESRYRKEINT